jgi:hypothetical protein
LERRRAATGWWSWAAQLLADSLQFSTGDFLRISLDFIPLLARIRQFRGMTPQFQLTHHMPRQDPQSLLLFQASSQEHCRSA